MSRIFYGVDISDPIFGPAFDVVRFILEPDAFRFAHITLRGPYQRQLSARALNAINESPRIRWMVGLNRVGRFFQKDQNTVFISLDLGLMREAWHKPDFPRGTAHITLYDGRSRFLASGICSELQRYKWQKVVTTTKVKRLQSKVGPGSDLFLHLLDVFKFYENYAPARAPRLEELAAESEETRLGLACAILERLPLETLSPAAARA